MKSTSSTSFRLTRAGAPLALAFVIVGGAACDARPVVGTDAGDTRCSADPDCDDGFPCTVDTCGVGGVCDHVAIDTRCAAGETCVVGRGCVSGMTCTTSAECADTIECTVDSCGVGGTCRHMALDELCTDPAMPECDETMGCVRGTGCATAADCNDDVDCTIDSCGAARTCTHTPMDTLCMEGETCLSTGCFASNDCDTADDCDDGLFCNGTETCDAKFGCLPGEPPACSDSETCTIDTCNDGLGRCDFLCDRTSSDPRCMAMAGCASTGPTCNGDFALAASTPIATCPFGDIRPTISALSFEWDGFDMVVTGNAATPLVMTSSTPPLCPTVNVTFTHPGMCNEVFNLVGSFTDDDTFTGALNVTYPGRPICGSLCRGPFSTPINATRM